MPDKEVPKPSASCRLGLNGFACCRNVKISGFMRLNPESFEPIIPGFFVPKNQAIKNSF
jgi:hypothetical protein